MRRVSRGGPAGPAWRGGSGARLWAGTPEPRGVLAREGCKEAPSGQGFLSLQREERMLHRQQALGAFKRNQPVEYDLRVRMHWFEFVSVTS